MFEETLERIESGVLERVDRYLKDKQEQRPRVTGLISQTDLKDELNISYQTVTRWERAGLRRYIPPLEDTRTAFYKVADILKFLGVDDGDH